MKTKKTPRKKALEKLDRVFSVWIRTRGADDNGNQRCYTCGVIKHWKELHAGHFVTRSKLATRWDPLNVRPQCYACNIHKHGNQWQFGFNLNQEHGEGTAEALQAKGNVTARFTAAELEALIDQYRLE